MTFVFMGLDLSLTSTGVSVGGSTSIVSSIKKGAERLSLMSHDVLRLAKDHNVTHVIVEGYSFASRNSQAHSIGELGGCVRMLLWEGGIPYIDVPPTSRAKFATGRGNAPKAEVVSAISAKTGLVFSGAGGTDECDAWILEQMALAKVGMSEYSWTAQQLSALDKIDWSVLERNK